MQFLKLSIQSNVLISFGRLCEDMLIQRNISNISEKRLSERYNKILLNKWHYERVFS